MKKLILLLALALVMCGCMKQNEDGSYKVGSNYNEFKVITIDSCEYIIEGDRLTHKGNCKFCAKRRIKEQEELIRKIKEQ